jgi:Uncharacterised protein, DegV family COG1307
MFDGQDRSRIVTRPSPSVVTVAPVIGICTDSSAQLPPDLAADLGVEVVPLTVTIGEVDHLDGVDLDADQFYGHFSAGAWPHVSMSEPSSGQMAAAYEDLVERGCTEILSIHVTSAVTGALSAARLAAHHSPVPVRVVDTGSVGFGVGCCVWAAADAIARGATLDQAAVAAELAAGQLGHLVLLRPPDGNPNLDLVQVGAGAVQPVGNYGRCHQRGRAPRRVVGTSAPRGRGPQRPQLGPHRRRARSSGERSGQRARSGAVPHRPQHGCTHRARRRRLRHVPCRMSACTVLSSSQLKNA